MRSAVILLVVVTFSLPVLAGTIDYASSGSGKDVSVTGAPQAGQTWSVTDDLIAIGSQTGSELGTVDITSGTLTTCSTGLCFSGGSVVIKSETGTMIFSGMFSSGTVTTSNGLSTLSANLMNGGTVEIANPKAGSYSSNTIVSTTIPEPNSLLLLGTGLITLWWKGREKLLAMKVK